MMGYYNREGKPISMEEWANLTQNDTYKIVDRTECEGILVSTVWLGLDHSFGSGPPVIFETMIFCEIPELDEWQERYSTEQEALEGHQTAVALVNKVLNRQ